MGLTRPPIGPKPKDFTLQRFARATPQQWLAWDECALKMREQRRSGSLAWHCSWRVGSRDSSIYALLAKCYLSGEGVKKNRAMALKLLRRAARNDPESARLVKILMKRGSHSAARVPSGMANVLSEEKRQQVIALGRLGWSLPRIEAEAGVRRETASAYLKEAGIEVRRAGRWGGRQNRPTK